MTDTFTFIKECPWCKDVSYVGNVSRDAILKWNRGMLIQTAFPNHNATEREIIKTGICQKCWDTL